MPRPDGSKQKWIEKGYEHFALFGPENISINAISKEIGSSRASFYHHFGGLEIFIDFLLETHLEAIKSFVNEGKKYCDRLSPDYYQLLVKFPMRLRFQRQIFFNRHIPIFGNMFTKIHGETSKGFVIDLFIKQFDLNIKQEDAAGLWLTLTESWFTRINPEKFDADELQQIGEEVMDSIVKFVSTT